MSKMYLYCNVYTALHTDDQMGLMSERAAPVLTYRTIVQARLQFRYPPGTPIDVFNAVDHEFAFSVGVDGIATNTPMTRTLNADFDVNPESGDVGVLEFPIDCATEEFRDAVAGKRPNNPLYCEGQLFVWEVLGSEAAIYTATFRFRAFNIVDDLSAAAPTSVLVS